MPISPSKHQYKDSYFPFPSTPSHIRQSTLSPAAIAHSQYIGDDDLIQHLSPSKAAAQTHLQNDLSHLTYWLESLFSPHPIQSHLLKWRDEVLSSSSASSFSTFDILNAPTRNHGGNISNSTSGSEILEALKAVKQANLSADHLHNLIHEARLEELRFLEELAGYAQQQRDEECPARMLLDELHATLSLDAQVALVSLAAASTALEIDFSPGNGTSFEEFRAATNGKESSNADGGNGDGGMSLQALFAKKLLERGHRQFVLDEQVREMEALRDRIESRTKDLQESSSGRRRSNEEGDDHHDPTAEQMHAQTTQFNRDTKQINLKIMEYQDRINGLERQLANLRSEGTSLKEVLDARERVKERKARVKALQERFAAFNGLPSDLKASRSEVKRAMNELEGLKRRRGELFEKIGHG